MSKDPALSPLVTTTKGRPGNDGLASHNQMSPGLILFWRRILLGEEHFLNQIANSRKPQFKHGACSWRISATLEDRLLSLRLKNCESVVSIEQFSCALTRSFHWLQG